MGLWVMQKRKWKGWDQGTVTERKPIDKPTSFLQVIACLLLYAFFSCAFPHLMTHSFLLKFKERVKLTRKNIQRLTYTGKWIKKMKKIILLYLAYAIHLMNPNIIIINLFFRLTAYIRYHASFYKKNSFGHNFYNQCLSINFHQCNTLEDTDLQQL